MDITNKLIQVLSNSIKKNGNQPLTTQHLLNILNYSVRSVEAEQEKIDKELDEAYMQILADECGDRD